MYPTEDGTVLMNIANVKKEIESFLSLGEDEQIEKLFFSDDFLESHTTLNEAYNEMVKEGVEKLESFQLTPLEPSTYNSVVMVTPSARVPGEWQRTIFQKGEPVSHCEYKSKEELLKENVNDWFRQGLWIDEDTKKDLN